MRRPLVALLVLTALARGLTVALILTVFWHTAIAAHLLYDLTTWSGFFEAVRAGRVPYVDFGKEYPVGCGLVYWALSPFMIPSDLREMLLVHASAMTVVDLVNVALFYRAARTWDEAAAFPFSLLFALNLTATLLSPLRFESVVVLFVLLGYLAHRSGHPLRATLFWSVGCSLKWFPAFFIAAQEYRAFFFERKRLQWLLSLLVFLAASLALNLPFLLGDYRRTGGIAEWLLPYRFHMVRPLYWDTVLGVVELWTGPFPLERWGSFWTLGLVVLALVAFPSLALEAKGVLVCCASLLVNRVYSSQFNLWFYPFLLLYALRTRRRVGLVALFVALDLLNVLIYPVSFAGAYEEMGTFHPFGAVERGGVFTDVFSAAIVLRALLLVVLAVVLTRGSSEGLEASGQ